LEYLQPVLKGFKVDLKTMQEKQYKILGGRLQPVLDSIIKAHELGMWVEVVTLVIPGFNDSTEELWDAARFIASVSADLPWHVTAYHPDYNHDAPPPLRRHFSRRRISGRKPACTMCMQATYRAG